MSPSVTILIMWPLRRSLRAARVLGDEESPQHLHRGLRQALRAPFGPFEEPPDDLVARRGRLRRADERREFFVPGERHDGLVGAGAGAAYPRIMIAISSR